jgi:hypothetical protein
MSTRIIRFALPIIIACATMAPLAAAWAAEPAAPYSSPKRQECEAELAKDATWQFQLRDSCRVQVHQEDANLFVKNKKHVVIGYAALWGLTVVFVVLMWLRQRRLMAEMDRLARQIAKAATE